MQYRVVLVVKNLPANAEDYYSCLENPRDGGVWWAALYGIAQSWT